MDWVGEKGPVVMMFPKGTKIRRAEIRDECTAAETARMNATARSVDDGIGLGTFTVEHPTRMHARFVASNQEDHGNALLASEDLGDGFTRVTYRLAGP